VSVSTGKIVNYRADLPAWIFVGGLSNFPWLIVWADAVHGVDFVSLYDGNQWHDKTSPT
jgi:hypothetical protein